MRRQPTESSPHPLALLGACALLACPACMGPQIAPPPPRIPPLVFQVPLVPDGKQPPVLVVVLPVPGEYVGGASWTQVLTNPGQLGMGGSSTNKQMIVQGRFGARLTLDPGEASWIRVPGKSQVPLDADLAYDVTLGAFQTSPNLVSVRVFPALDPGNTVLDDNAPWINVSGAGSSAVLIDDGSGVLVLRVHIDGKETVLELGKP